MLALVYLKLPYTRMIVQPSSCLAQLYSQVPALQGYWY